MTAATQGMPPLPPLSSRPERNAVEGPAVSNNFRAMLCLLDDSSCLGKCHPQHPCHPDRSVAKWKDLQFPTTSVQCCVFLDDSSCLGNATLTTLVIPTGA